jgi:hypothetical protein
VPLSVAKYVAYMSLGVLFWLVSALGRWIAGEFDKPQHCWAVGRELAFAAVVSCAEREYELWAVSRHDSGLPDDEVHTWLGRGVLNEVTDRQLTHIQNILSTGKSTGVAFLIISCVVLLVVIVLHKRYLTDAEGQAKAYSCGPVVAGFLKRGNTLVQKWVRFSVRPDFLSVLLVMYVNTMIGFVAFVVAGLALR